MAKNNRPVYSSYRKPRELTKLIPIEIPNEIGDEINLKLYGDAIIINITKYDVLIKQERTGKMFLFDIHTFTELIENESN